MKNSVKYVSFGVILLSLTNAFGCKLLAGAPLELTRVRTLVGTGKPGSVDGPATEAMLNRPHGLTQDQSGYLFVADRGNHQIRKVSLATGAVTTLAGVAGQAGFSDGQGDTAKFSQPIAVVVNRQGVVYIADRDNHRIRKVDTDGNVSTQAGSGTAGFGDGDALSAKFNQPYGLALDLEEKNLLVADYLNHSIRKIDLASGAVTTVAGNGTAGNVNGPAQEARFNQPYNIKSDGLGNYLIPDQLNHSIRKLTASGAVLTLAGTGQAGFTDGAVAVAQFNNPTGIAAGPGGEVFVADRNNHRVRKISPNGQVTTVAGTGLEGDMDGSLAEAAFRRPLDLLVDADLRTLIVSEENGHRIRIIE